jgi:hypothetical protein
MGTSLRDRLRQHPHHTDDQHHGLERDRSAVKRRLRRAWAEPDHRRALEQLRGLAGELDRSRPGAAGALRESLQPTLRTCVAPAPALL